MKVTIEDVVVDLDVVKVGGLNRLVMNRVTRPLSEVCKEYDLTPDQLRLIEFVEPVEITE